MIGKSLLLYICIGAVLGLLHDSIWTGISAMVLIYIATRIDEHLRFLRN